MEAHQFACFLLGAKTLRHDVVPHTATGTELRNFFEEVVMTVPEEAESWTNIVYIETSINCCLHVCNGVRQRECELLNCSASRFANVITRNGNGVPLWNVL